MKLNKKLNDGPESMIDQKRFTELLFKNLGLISFIIGISFLIFGAINFNVLPRHYTSQSGSPGFDGQVNVLVNGILWLTLCLILMLIGIEFHFSGKKVMNIQSSGDGLITIRFCLIAGFLACGTFTYIVLILTNVVRPIQFFPHLLFVGEVTLMDFSIAFNTILFILLISILYRVAYKLIKYGFKIGEVK